MKISAISVESFKRIERIDIAPGADKVLVLISGRNGQGKSSLLDALSAAFGGKAALPADPVRHGAEAAEIRVELDGGALTIKRVIKADGESALEVRDADGKVRSPQAKLDKLLGARFLDPLAFIQMPAAEQRKALLAIVDGEGKIAALETRRVRLFDRRTEVSRDQRKAAAELERMPDVAPADPIDVAAMSHAVSQLEDEIRAGAKAEQVVHDAQKRLEAQAAKVDRVERQLAELTAELEIAEQQLVADQDALDTAKQAHAAAPKFALGEVAQKRISLRAKLEEATRFNQSIAVEAAARARRGDVAREVKTLTDEVTALTSELDKIDASKTSILAASALPVKGLDVDVSGVRFNGVPFAQASGAEQLSVALALSMAASPDLHDVWVRDGALLDDESMLALERAAEAAGVRVWLERVGDRDPGAIIIENGRTCAPLAKAV